MEIERAKRFATAADMRAALNLIRRPYLVDATRTTDLTALAAATPAASPRPDRRRRALVLIAVPILLFLGVLIGIALQANTDSVEIGFNDRRRLHGDVHADGRFDRNLNRHCDEHAHQHADDLGYRDDQRHGNIAARAARCLPRDQPGTQSRLQSASSRFRQLSRRPAPTKTKNRRPLPDRLTSTDSAQAGQYLAKGR